MALSDLGRADRFLAGTVGEPGERTFYLEVEANGSTSWYAVEKAQVLAICTHAAELLEDRSHVADAPAPPIGNFDPPSDVAFVVGEVRIAYRENPDLVVVNLLAAESDEEIGVAFAITPAQLDAMVQAGLELVAAGRPACPRCGLAMDPDGHACPVDNGDLRGHRP